MTNIIRTTTIGTRARDIAGTLAIAAIVDAQRRGGVCAYVDTLASLDTDHLLASGVNVADLLISQPEGLDEASEIVDTLARTGAIDLIVVDADCGLPVGLHTTTTIMVLS